MTPITQEFLHDPDNGVYGDCQRAVIASLLNLPISEVPHFLADGEGDAVKFWEGLQKFLGKHGYAWFTVPARSGGAFFGHDGGVYHEISGPSPRGEFLHAVIGLDGNVVFDPHPSRAGLCGDPSEWVHGYLVYVGITKGGA